MTGPLAGRTVVVTRDEAEDGPLGRALRALGATVRRVPCVETAPPLDPDALVRALISGPDWLFVTSARAVPALADAAAGAGRGGSSRAPGPRVAAVGPATAAALEEAGLPAHVVSDGGAETLVEAMAGVASLTGARVLFPASDRARREGPRALRAAGADVTEVVAYRILTREGARRELRALAFDPAVHALAFTSPSAAGVLGPAAGADDPAEPPGRSPCRIAAIGPTTAAALEALGWKDVLVPPRPDFPSLARTLAEALGGAS